MSNTPTPHAEYGPSSLALFELCSHYGREESDEVHPVTLQGTRLHEAVEHDNLNGLDHEETKLAQFCLDETKRLASGADEYHKEVTLDIAYDDKQEDYATFGTVDFVAISGDTAVVIDYKFGYHGVDAATSNAQGQAYVLGVFEKFPEVQSVYLHFILARRHEVTSAIYTREDHEEAIRGRIVTIIERAKQKTGDPTPCPRVCTYCGNKVGCSAWIQNALTLRNKYHDDYKQLDVTKLTELHLSKADDVDVAEVAAGMEIADEVEKWAKAYKHHAKGLVLEQGLEIPGYKTVERKLASSVQGDAAETLVVLQDQGFDVKEQDMLRSSKPDMTALETLIKQRAATGKKGADATRMRATLLDGGILSSGGTSVSLQKEKKKTT